MHCATFFVSDTSHMQKQSRTQGPRWALISFDILLSGCVDLCGIPFSPLSSSLHPSHLLGSFQCFSLDPDLPRSFTHMSPPLPRLTDKDVLMKSQQSEDSSHAHISLVSSTDMILRLLHGNMVPIKQYAPTISGWQSQTLVLWTYYKMLNSMSTDAEEYHTSDYEYNE